MNLTRQTFRNLLCLFLSLIFCIGMLSACSKRPDPLAKTGIRSVTLDKKERVCVEVTIDARTLEEHGGETLRLYELLPGEGVGSVSSKEPLDEKKADSAVSFRVPLTDGDRTRLYSSFAVFFEDGTALEPHASYIENPEVLATEKNAFTWKNSPKALAPDDVEHALELGVMHAVVDVSLAMLVSAEDQTALSEPYLKALDAEIGAAAEAGMQVTLRILPDQAISNVLGVTVIDTLGERYADKVSAHWIGASGETLSAANAAYLCRISKLALSSRMAGARVYLEAPKNSAVDTKAFFSDVMISLDNGGAFEWGAVLAPSTEEGLMSPDDLSEIGAFVMKNGTAGHASRLAVTLPSFDAEDEELQAVKLAYAYRLSLSAGAGLILYPSHFDDENGLCALLGEQRLAAETFATLDTGLTDEFEALCVSFVGERWNDLKTPAQISRRRLVGISNAGTDGMSRSPIFDFSEGDTLGFTGICTMDPPVIRESAAWGRQVLYTWLDPSASRFGGVRRVLDDGSILSFASSLTVHLLTQAQTTDTCTAVLTMEGTTVDGIRLSYKTDVSLVNGEWQTVTFQIGGFTADLDPNRPCVISVTVAPDSDTQEPYVLWIKGLDVRRPDTGTSPILPTVLILGGAVLSFAAFFAIYIATTKKRRR